LGELRAQAVKRLLIQQGVPAHKMMTVSASTPLYGAGNEPQPTKPEDMRVSISIILRAQAAAPGGQMQPAP
jgi:outer membrane protein OmpA-like peptidoglycan-associated protein